MKKYKTIGSVLIIALVLQMFSMTAFAADASLTLSAASGYAGDSVTVSGTSDASQWITVKALDGDGNIVYLNAILSGSDGSYKDTFIVPDVSAGTLRVVAGYGGDVANADFTIKVKPSGGRSSTGTVTTTTSTVSAYDSNAGKTSAVAITSATNSSTSTTTATVTSANMTSLIADAKKAESGLAGIAAIEINVLSTGTVKTVEVSMPAASFTELSDSTDAKIKINTGLGTISLDSKAAGSIGDAGNTGNLSIRIAQTDSGSLSNDVKAAIGDRPVYALSITSGGMAISSFGGGKATVSIPYTLATGEDANKIVIYYISGDGKLVMVPNCIYDASTGTVTFTTTHFSNYAVGYNNVSFTDVSGWYTDYVSYLAARGIIGGTGGGKFSPDSNITRAQFVTILARMSGDDLSGYTASSFSDVTTTDWYFAAVQWAYKNGIAVGSDGKFNPNASITREQMAAMLYRYAEYVGDVTNAEGMSAREFSDYASISSWAQAPVQWAVNNGIITGNPDGSFAPGSNATRAQAAKMIAVLLKGMIKN